MPGRDPAGTGPPGGAVTAGDSGARTLPVCPGCGADLHWLTGSTLACQRCGYSMEPAQ